MTNQENILQENSLQENRLILAIESSCDETSAAVLHGSNVLSNVISSQLFHSKYGGVVPELASRSHLQKISEITKQALEESKKSISEIEAIAVTTSPGLMGALLVGSSFAKGLALANSIPIIPTNHIEGHLYSGCLEDESLEFPFLSMVVSGGHTSIFLVKDYNNYEIIGSTKDDAAGEAFDKIGKMMGLPYPAGPIIDKLAKNGNPKKYDFPRSMIHSNDYNFSFSGLKTSVRYFIQKNFVDGINENELNDMAASVQEAIVDVLVKKCDNAILEFKPKGIVISGGVSANSLLRSKIQEIATKRKIKSVCPEMSYCLDNAAMIGFIASKRINLENKNNYMNLSFKTGSNPIRAKK